MKFISTTNFIEKLQKSLAPNFWHFTFQIQDELAENSLQDETMEFRMGVHMIYRDVVLPEGKPNFQGKREGVSNSL